MSNRKLLAMAIVSLTLVSANGSAQGGRGGRRQNPPGGDGGARGGALPAQRIGEALAEVMQLNDQQRPRFAEVNRRFVDRERALMDEERIARTSMRNLLCSGDTTRGPELSKSLDQVLDIQKRRQQMMEDEQRELGAFLTPYQRARYLGSRELLMDRLGRGGGGRGGQGRMGPPPQGGGGPPPDGPPPEGRGPGGPPRDICAQPPQGGPAGLRRGR